MLIWDEVEIPFYGLMYLFLQAGFQEVMETLYVTVSAGVVGDCEVFELYLTTTLAKRAF